MNSRVAKQNLNLFRPGDEDEFSRSADSLTALKDDALLWKEFQLDQSVDAATRAALEELHPTETERSLLQTELAEIQSRKRAHGFSMSDPGVLSVALGFLLLMGLALWHFLGESDKFSGYDEVVTLVEQGTQMDAGQFEPVQTKLGAMDDWFAMNGLDRFWVPPSFAHLESIGARVMRFQTVPVAQIAVPSPQMLILVFRGQPLGISVGREGVWKFIEGKPYSSAITEKDGICFLVSIRGTKEEVEQLVDEVRRATP